MAAHGGTTKKWLEKKVFNIETLPLFTKVSTFLVALFACVAVFYVYQFNVVGIGTTRLFLYLLFVVIFFSSFFSGFGAGVIIATLSSAVALSTIAPQDFSLLQIGLTEAEVFPFIAVNYLIAITVDWFKQNIQELKEMVEENEMLHKKAQRAEKMVAAGEISACVAHEIRNPLAVANGYIQMLEGKYVSKEEKENNFALVRGELERAGNIVTDFLRFSRLDQPEITLLQIGEVADLIASLLKMEAGKNNVVFNVLPYIKVQKVNADREQLVQVLMNLCRNAIQAMPNGGILEISFDTKPDNVVIKVRDTGPGIPQEELDEIFSPFFTTKEDGTGLGLFISRAIVDNHGGKLAVESTVGEGTCFFITLPAALHQEVYPPGEEQATPARGGA